MAQSYDLIVIGTGAGGAGARSRCPLPHRGRAPLEELTNAEMG